MSPILLPGGSQPPAAPRPLSGVWVIRIDVARLFLNLFGGNFFFFVRNFPCHDSCGGGCVVHNGPTFSRPQGSSRAAPRTPPRTSSSHRRSKIIAAANKNYMRARQVDTRHPLATPLMHRSLNVRDNVAELREPVPCFRTQKAEGTPPATTLAARRITCAIDKCRPLTWLWRRRVGKEMLSLVSVHTVS